MLRAERRAKDVARSQSHTAIMSAQSTITAPIIRPATPTSPPTTPPWAKGKPAAGPAAFVVDAAGCEVREVVPEDEVEDEVRPRTAEERAEPALDGQLGVLAFIAQVSAR